MKPVPKAIRRREGDLIKINLGDDRHCYAQVATEPLIVFFGGVFAEDIGSEDIARLPVIFRICVMNDAVKHGRWPVVGWSVLAPENRREPFFFKQDAMTGRLALYHSSFAATGWERAASLSECAGLECAAVWDAQHEEDRLRDYHAGKPNKWVESLQIDVRAIP